MNLFTEQDLQDYFEGSFKGDAEALHQYFTEDNNRKAIFENYRLLFEVLKEGELAFTIPAIEQKLIASLQKQKDKKQRAQDLWISASLILVIIFACIYCVFLLRRLQFNVRGAESLSLVLVAVVSLCFLVLSYWGEIRKLKRKYSL